MHALVAVLLFLLLAPMGAQAAALYGINSVSGVNVRDSPLEARVTCKAGEFKTNNNCQSCSQGYKCDGTNQTPCGLGYYSANGASTCTICPAGSYCSSTTTVTPTVCNPGTYSAKTGATSSSTCTACAAGYFSTMAGSTACCACCAGFYAPNTGMTTCQSCGSGMTTPVAATSSSQCSKALTPKAVTTCSQNTSTGTCPATTGTNPSQGPGKRAQRPVSCAKFGYKSCPVLDSRNQKECIDVENDLESCGGCMDLEPSAGGGVDCTSLPGVRDVGCKRGKCVVSRCAPGYDVSPDSTTCIPSAMVKP